MSISVGSGQRVKTQIRHSSYKKAGVIYTS